jgi:Co/Zn/Cd efflux system component
MGVAFAYSTYAVRVGQEINSPSLVADAKHIGVDMFAGAAVLAGLAGSLAGLPLDRVAAFIVVAMVVWAGLKILGDGIRVLLDASLDYPTLRLAEQLILAEPQVTAIEHLTGRNSGRYKFIEANILLKAHELDKAAFIANRIAANISEKIKNVDRVLIHYEPIRKEALVYALPLEDAREERISEHFGEAPCFALITVGIRDRKPVAREILINPFTQVKGPFYVFSNAAVDTFQTRAETPQAAMADLGLAAGG